MKLNEAPLDKPDVNELHPDVNTTSECFGRFFCICAYVGQDTSASFHNYLDDFLQAVRVFGFVGGLTIYKNILMISTISSRNPFFMNWRGTSRPGGLSQETRYR